MSNYWDDSKELTDIQSGEIWTLYGPSGKGKTTLLGSFPKPIQYFDIKDKGSKSLVGLKGVKAKKIDTESQMQTMLEDLQKAKDVPFKTLAIDTLSNFQDLVLVKHQQTITKSKKLKIDSWGYISTTMKNLIAEFKDEADRLEIIVVFICQQKGNDQDDDGSDDMDDVVPNLIKSVHPFLCSLSDYVIHVTTLEDEDEKLQYAVDIGINDTYVTKVRTTYTNRGRVPAQIINPSYKKITRILDRIENKKTAQKRRKK